MSIEETLSLWIANDSGLYFALVGFKDSEPEAFEEAFKDLLQEAPMLIGHILADILRSADWHEIMKDVYSS